MRVASVIVAIVVAGVLVHTLKGYLALPTVGIDSGGRCVWVEQAPDYERKPCTRTPRKYHKVRVP